MHLWELFIIAAGVSMDAFAVSVCKGLGVRNMEWKHGLLAGLYFGGFQALMPLLGYLCGVRFQHMIVSVDHWIAFVLLGLIGVGMIREAGEPGECLNPSFDLKTMLPMAMATSIDALAVGVTFAFLHIRIIPAVCLIGLTTFCLSAVGVMAGHAAGRRCQSGAQLAGGLILIAMGFKILLEHLGVL